MYTLNFIEIGQTFCGRTDGCTYWRTDISPLMLLSRLGGVDLITFTESDLQPANTGLFTGWWWTQDCCTWDKRWKQLHSIPGHKYDDEDGAFYPMLVPHLHHCTLPSSYLANWPIN